MLHLISDILGSTNGNWHSHSLGIDHCGLFHCDGRAALGIDNRLKKSLYSWHFNVLNDGVRRISGEVESEMPGHPSQSPFRWDAGLDPLVFLFRLRTCFRNDSLQTVNQLNRARCTIEFVFKAIIEISGILLHPVDIRMNCKNCLGMLCSEITPLA